MLATLSILAFIAGLGVGVIGCFAVLIWQGQRERPGDPDAG